MNILLITKNKHTVRLTPLKNGNIAYRYVAIVCYSRAHIKQAMGDFRRAGINIDEYTSIWRSLAFKNQKD
jgi:hypothetical protein